MSYKSKKKLVIWSGIIIILGVIASLFLLMYLIHNCDLIYNLFQTNYGQTTQAYNKYISNIETIITISAFFIALVSIIFGICFIVIGCSWDESKYVSNNIMFLTMTLISYIFSFNVIAFIMLLIVTSNSIRFTDKTKLNKNSKITDSKNADSTILKIEKLKKLKNSGCLTDEEYTKILFKILK